MRKFFIFLTVIVVIVTLVVIAIETWKYAQEIYLSNILVVRIDGEEQVTDDIQLDGFVPGESKDYTLKLYAGGGHKFDITMELKEGDVDTLSPFIDMEVLINGDVIESGKLSEYFDGKKICFTADFSDSQWFEIDIKYSMGIEVGDEAQNTESEFKIHITSNKKK